MHFRIAVRLFWLLGPFLVAEAAARLIHLLLLPHFHAKPPHTSDAGPSCVGNGLPVTGVLLFGRAAVLNSRCTAAKSVFCQLLPAMPVNQFPGNLPD